MKLPGLGIEWNHDFSTKKIFVSGHAESIFVKYPQKYIVRKYQAILYESLVLLWKNSPSLSILLKIFVLRTMRISDCRVGSILKTVP